MDIRIGNDIRLNVAISDFDKFDDETIKCAHCFLMSESEKNLINVDPKPTVLSTKYTLHHSDARIYNVLPINAQVRPLDGPGFFGKTLRQYGKPIFTFVSECDGYIYGFFKGREQFILGDYYLVVMVTFNRPGFGENSSRTVVINYGYAFTLTMDGDVCDKDGIYMSRRKDEFQKTRNTIIWDEDPSAGTHYVGDVVRFSAHTADGAVIVFKDSSDNLISGTTNAENVYSGYVILNNKTTVVKAIAQETEDHLQTQSTKTIHTTEIPVIETPIPNLYALSRSSSAPVPYTTENLSSIDSSYNRTGQFTNNQILDCTGLTALDSNSRFKMCWFAVSSKNNLRIEDADSHDNITDDFTPVIIGDYKVYVKTQNVSDWSQLRIQLIIS